MDRQFVCIFKFRYSLYIIKGSMDRQIGLNFEIGMQV